jgi:V-type H+-transporting ATPase subunit D
MMSSATLIPVSVSHSEEFFRLKKIQGKKKRDTEAAQAEIAAEKQEDVEYSADSGIGGGDAGGRDMLDQGKDEDVIF